MKVRIPVAIRTARLGCLAVLLLGSPLRAQNPPAEVQIFEAAIDVRVVNVESVVTDGGGARVRGLGAADFRLLVDGVEVPIEYFVEVTSGKSVAAEPAGAAVGAPVPPATEVARNYLVYIDESFSVSAVRNEILNKLNRDLALMQPGDQLALMAFDGKRLEVLSGWTGDRRALAGALERARRRPTAGNRLLSHQRALLADEKWITDSADSFEADQVAEIMSAFSTRVSPEARTQLGRSAAAAASALRGFEAPPGRKVMLLLSAAWSLRIAPPLYRPLIEAANRLGYTLYPVDVAKSEAQEISVLDALARSTGGRAAVSARMEVFKEVVADTDSYYWFGFTPQWQADDRGHRVTLEARRPGLTVRARSGFSDLSRATVNALKAESVLLFGGAEQERRLIVQLGAPRAAGRGVLEVPVTLGVPVEALDLQPQGGGYIADTPLSVASMDAKGRRADLPAARLRVSLRTLPLAGTYARFQTSVKVRALGQRLVFTVRDPSSGATLWGEATFDPTRQPRAGG